MKPVTFHLPRQLVFGDHCMDDFISFFREEKYRKSFIVADPNVKEPLKRLISALEHAGIGYTVSTSIANEPAVSAFREIIRQARQQDIDSVIGMGGGSVLDVAKLLAALYDKENQAETFFGTGKISHRGLFLACLPTTAGTGSEVSPNAILLDDADLLKKGIVSPFLVPDVTFIDPLLTHSVPPHVTASTGIDALTHCIEAFANKYARPATDLYALEGIKLIFNNLEEACTNGQNSKARSKVALGSMYGGMCLGPVNTAAVHALAYPLGGEYHIAHGVSNALLLPHVLRMNLPDGFERYAQIAGAIGVPDKDPHVKAFRGIERISDLCKRIGIPEKLTSFHVPVEDVPRLAKSAMTVQRLLKNNLHELSENEVRDIYYKLF